MDAYRVHALGALLAADPYPGRGIVIGKTADGQKAVAAYFIMGRSQNSRNRVFEERAGEIFTTPWDASRVQDPSLIIYRAVRQDQNHLIVTNGDQTDTVYDGLQKGLGLAESLAGRAFEPDAPNYTPRISGLLTFAEGDFTYEMSILKSADAEGSACARYTFAYPALPGLGHFLHTYAGDGNPLPPFAGEPERVALGSDIDAITREIWTGLNEDNKISLYVRAVDLATGRADSRLVNKNKGE